MSEHDTREHMDNGISVHMCPNDTREQLEADIHRAADEMEEFTNGEKFINTNKILRWLDRQAAITANETNHNNPYVGLVRGKQWERTEISDYYCGRCGWKVTDHDSYCPECGGALHIASNKPDSKFDVLKTAENAENATSKNEIRNFDDSREQLEADAGELTADYAASGGVCDALYQGIIELLDRQAAITTAYCTSEGESCCEACRAAQKRKLAELTAERDELRERLDAMKAVLDKWVKSTVGIELPDCQITEFQSKDKDRRIAELTAERDDLRRITEELEKRNGELLEGRAHWIDQAISIYRRFYPHDGCAVPADVCSMVIAKIDELEAERDELQAALKRERAEWESERDYANQCEERLNELTAERDKWMARAEQVQESYLDAKDSRDNLQEAIDAMGNGQLYAMYRKVCAERDALKHEREKVWCDCDCCGWQAEREQMQRVIHTQAESFKKIEFELAKAKGAAHEG